MKRILFVIGCLIILSSCTRIIEKKRIEQSKIHLKVLSLSLIQYYENYGHYPEYMKQLVDDEILIDTNNRMFLDPWDQKVIYQLNSDQTGYKLISYGPDKREGGDGINRDIQIDYNY